jgi:hypothetical protein
MTREPLISPSVRQPPDSRLTDQVAVAAIGTVVADTNELARLRAEPGPAVGADLPNLRHADEQSVLALAAVLRAAAGQDVGPFADWGVIVAPRWQGRFGTGATVAKFHAAGVRGVGPHAIPNYCLHAPAATVSIALAAHGVVFGAGGGPAHVPDGLFAGLAMQLAGGSPGTWLALTDWTGDLADGTGEALALALVPHGSARARWSLAFRPATRPPAAPPRLVGLLDFLGSPTAVRWDCPVAGGELTLAAEARP